jgi:hypothetical protein
MRGRIAATALTVAGVAASLALAGCSSHPSLDTTAAQRQIDAQLAAYYRPIAVSGTRCPSKVTARKGATFRCTAQVAGQDLAVVVTQVDGKGGVAFAPQAAVIQVPATARDLQAKLGTIYNRDGASTPVRVDCGTAKVRVVVPKASFTCKVTAGTQHFEERVTAVDLHGNVSYAQAAPSPPAN